MGANPAQVYVISDVEGTLTQGVMWKAIGAYLNANVSPEIHRRFLRRNLPRMLLFRFGLLERSSFQNRWIADQARLLEGRTRAEMAEFSRWIVAEDLWLKRQEAVIAELLEWRGKGAAIILASGLYQSIVEAYGEKLAAQPLQPVLGAPIELPPVLALGTPLEFSEDRFTGRFGGAVCNGLEKARRAGEVVGGSPVAAAYGDSFSDIPMLELSAAPVVVNPEEELKAYADQKGWRGLVNLKT